MDRIIAVVGLGYVGLPVAVAFGKSAKTIGFDINATRIAELKSGYDRTDEVTTEDLRSADILFTDKIEELRLADFHIVAVPTPIDDAKQPDLYSHDPADTGERRLQGGTGIEKAPRRGE